MTSSQVLAKDVNTLASFLAHQQAQNLPDAIHNCGTQKPILIICGSGIFPPFESAFAQLNIAPSSVHTLLLVGGVGHSTPYLYEAVRQCPRYAHIYDWLVRDQVAESMFMYRAMEEWGLQGVLQEAGVRLLQETKSTNCGANAIEAMKVLREEGVPEILPIIIVQDPTMSLRTLACFEKGFEGRRVEQRPRSLQCLPTFVPKVKWEGETLVFDKDAMPTDNIWSMARFLDLVLGEIPRLRDDENGYGPKGKGFIPRVDIPEEVEEAWARLKAVVETRRQFT